LRDDPARTDAASNTTSAEADANMNATVTKAANFTTHPVTAAKTTKMPNASNTINGCTW
jgi:hypothetical protein